MQVGEAFIAVRADTSKVAGDMKGVEKAGSQAAVGLKDALVGGAVAVGFSKLIGSASSLTEAANKVAVTFGESAGSVEDFASTSADSLGIAESAALSLAGGLGSMLIPLGISQEQAASMSTTMLTLAADMGSFNDQDPTEMLERIRAGLAGESEPLRQYGANLSEARVQQFAWANGIAESGTALDEQQKVMARYGLLLQDTSIQQGDFARTSDSAANAQRRAAATAEDSAAAIGENFIPVYEQALAVVQTLAQAFGALPGPLQTGIVLLGGYIALRAPFAAAFGSMAGSVAKLRGALVLLQGAFLGAEVAAGSAGAAMALSLGPWAALAAILVGIQTGLIDVTNGMNQVQLDTQNVDKMTAAMNEAGSASEGLVNHLSDVSEFDPSFFEAMDVTVEEFATALLGGERAWDTFVDRVTGNLPEGANLDQWNEALATHRTRAQASAEAMDTANTANAEAGGAAETATSAFADEATALGEVADSADTARDMLDQLFGIQRSVQEGAIAVRDAARDLFQSFLELGEGGFRAGTAASDAFTSSMQNSLTAISDQTIAMYANGSSIQEVRRFQRGMVDDQVALARAAGMPEAAIRRLVAVFGTVPRRLLTDVEQRGAEEVQRQAGDTREAINKIPKFGRVEITANNRQAMAEISEARRAAEAWAAMTYEAQIRVSTQGLGPIQGARGRETASDMSGLDLDTQAAPFTSTPVTVNVNGSIVGDVERFADEIAYRAAEKLSMTGGF